MKEDLFIQQGTDWSDTIDFTNDDFTPVNLTGYIFSSSIKTSSFTANGTANLTITILNPVAGNVMVSLPATVSANMRAGTYVYDILMLDTFGFTTKVMKGQLHLRPTQTGINPPFGGLPAQGGSQNTTPWMQNIGDSDSGSG